MFVTKAVRSGTLVTLLTFGLAACGDFTTAPAGSSPGLSPEAAALLSSGTSGTSGRGQESGTRTFTIWPGLPIGQRFGDHVLFVPADAVCDPATSGYGAALWDAPCQPISRPVEVTATWTTRNDKPVVSFSPDLRFVPSSDESRWVKLSLKDSRGIDPSYYYAILWYDKQLGQWVDESKTDPTLKAHPNQSGNLVTRRLKHFSDWALWVGLGSYNVTSGLGGELDVWGGW
jgi:hypothetical protein